MLSAERHRASPAGEPDELGQRCPYSRQFSPGFAECEAYQPVSFTAADSTYKPIGPSLTCLHLSAGEVSGRPGRFYPRCALGTRLDRVQWVARVTPERLEIARLVQEAFDHSTSVRREDLFEAKKQFLHSPGTRELRVRLEDSAANFLDVCARFVTERESEFRSAGLPAGPLMELIEDWVRVWMRSPQLYEVSADSARRRAFSPMPELNRPLDVTSAHNGAIPPPRASASGDGRGGLGNVMPTTAHTVLPLYEDAILQIWQSNSSPVLRFAGDIDASNADAVIQSLQVAADGDGDVQVDLTGMSFCDVNGLRVFVQAAGALTPGRRLLLRGLPSHLRSALQLVGWAQLPGLVVADTDLTPGTEPHDENVVIGVSTGGAPA